MNNPSAYINNLVPQIIMQQNRDLGSAGKSLGNFGASLLNLKNRYDQQEQQDQQAQAMAQYQDQLGQLLNQDPQAAYQFALTNGDQQSAKSILDMMKLNQQQQAGQMGAGGKGTTPERIGTMFIEQRPNGEIIATDIQTGQRITDPQEIQRRFEAVRSNKVEDALRQKTAEANAAQAVKDFTTVNKDANAARRENNQLNKLLSLNDKAYGGQSAQFRKSAARFLQNFGIDAKGLPETELFEAIANNIILDQSQLMSGALSENDMRFLAATAPELSKTAEGRKKLIKYKKALNDRQIEKQRQARAFRKRNDGMFDQALFDQEFQAWAEKNPLFENETMPEVKAETKTVNWNEL